MLASAALIISSEGAPRTTLALQSTPSISRTDRACSPRSTEADSRSASTMRLGLSSSTTWTSDIAASNFFASRVARRIARSERVEKSVATSIFFMRHLGHGLRHQKAAPLDRSMPTKILRSSNCVAMGAVAEYRARCISYLSRALRCCARQSLSTSCIPFRRRPRQHRRETWTWRRFDTACCARENNEAQDETRIRQRLGRNRG